MKTTLVYPGSLHNHTDFSNFRLRDCINRYDELIDYAIELGHEVIAFTEHETVANAVKIEKYYKKVKEKNPNFKVILGNEIYLCRNGLSGENFVAGADKYFHFILLAKDAEGHKQIRELSSRAWLRSYTSRNQIRVPTYYSDLEEIIGNNPGHVIGLTACLGGFLATKILQMQSFQSEDEREFFYLKIKDWLRQMVSIFTEGNFYLEMQPSVNKEQTIVNKTILQLSKELNIPYTITNDSHYASKSEAFIHKAFLNSQDGDREVDSFYATTYLMDTEELESFFDYFTQEEIEEAYKNILEIKNKCEDFSLLKPLKIPSLPWKVPKVVRNVDYYCGKIPYLKTYLESDFAGDRRMAELIIEKFETDPRVREDRFYLEVNNNLEATWISSKVNKAHWSAYFLNLQQILESCWESGTLVSPGRGSGVGFILLWFLDIIQINSLWENTPTTSWRFLNPERVSVLDIDVDIESGARKQVLDGLRSRYGQDRVANVVTFSTEKSKSAVLTAARGLGVELETASYISSLIPADRGTLRTLKQCYYGDENNGFAPIGPFINEMDAMPELWRVAQKIEGLISRVG